MGQTYQNVTAGRVAGTTYYNTSGKPIFLSVFTGQTTGEGLQLIINGAIVADFNFNATTALSTVQGIIPPSSSYSVNVVTGAIAAWYELR